MRKFALALALCSPLLAGCAGGSSRYGCPAEPGYSCRSVSEVYAGEVSGRAGGERPLIRPPEKGKIVRAAAGRKLPKGAAFRPGKIERRKAGAARAGETMPVYVPPRAIRLRIAPWQDSRGVFHSEKYVYLLAGGGRWTIGGRTVPLGEPVTGRPGDIRLRGTGGTP